MPPSASPERPTQTPAAPAAEAALAAKVPPSEAPPAAAVAEKPKTVPGTTAFEVQAAAYREKVRAERLAEKMAALGFPSQVVARDLPGKGRWYQVPDNDNVPLFGHLLDEAYDKSSGSSNYIVCVSCHDPHGVASSALPASVRRFSGANDDNGTVGRKMMRFNFSSGTPTALCVVCHK